MSNWIERLNGREKVRNGEERDDDKKGEVVGMTMHVHGGFAHTRDVKL